MTTAIIWSKYNCPNCEQALKLLKSQGYTIEERKIGDGWTKEDLLEIFPSARSVPQVIIDNTVIGGMNELKQYFNQSAI